MPRPCSLGARVYSAALFLYPASFRREFSSEMVQDFAEATEETRLSGGWRDKATLWTRVASDLATTVVVQWLRTGLPVLLLCSTVGATVVTGLATQLLLRAPLPEPALAADRDLITFIFLVAAVLLIICATIVFTFWLSRSLVSRRR